ncbi:amino acid adenylation domain-containing protein [Nonomuraea sp. NPDC050556]|uniref:amino acid adenylation domain-containing protein n=1 Tax=Nonomuraea sp. NPDC050556 TaxID=3364369 RepID=UPI00379C2F8B
MSAPVPHTGPDSAATRLAAAHCIDQRAVLLAAFTVLAARLGAGQRPPVDLYAPDGTACGQAVLPGDSACTVVDLLKHASDSWTAAQPGLRGAALAASTGPAHLGYDLELLCGLPGQAVLAARADRVSPQRAVTLAEQLGAVVAQAASAPQQIVASLDTLTPGQRSEVGSRWSQGVAPAAPEALLPGLAREGAQRHPDRTAVLAGQQTLSYAELADAVDVLASRLSAAGVGPDVRVAVHLSRSPLLVVALLAVARAGGAYVPLDPAGSARQRTAAILTDCGCQLVVTTTGLAAGLPLPLGAQLLLLDQPAERVQVPAAAPAPHHLAYVIYTSGSSGQPKGVMVSHAALSNYLRWCATAYTGAGSGTPLFSSAAFDLAVTSLFAPLLAGQHLVLAPDDADFVELAELLADHRRLAFAKLTPTHLDLLHRLGSPEVLDAAEIMVVGGEALTADLVRPWLAASRVINEYGPTEACVAATVHHVVDAGQPGESVPIGRPIPGTEVLVLDARMRLLPPGETGEIYLGGVCLARGYLGWPAQTAERFVPHPLRPGQRLYRSGDLGMWRQDGELVYLGRIDDQIKLRGYRIEPGEVEAALRSHPAVTDAVVVAAPAACGSRGLVAHLVLQAGPVPGDDQLRRYLRALIPDYMIPSRFRVLERLPMTGNGKVDRASLVAVGGER